MDEATPRIQHALTGLQGLPAGAVITEAKRLARNAIKAQWQAQGRKVPHIPYIELVNAAQAYLDSHQAELISQARANLCQWSVRLVPQKRTLAQPIERQREEIQR